MAITQDGYAENASGGNQTGGSVTLSTTNANDIIVLKVFSEDDTTGFVGSPAVINAVSSTHTTGWTKRSSTTSTSQGAGKGAALDVWYGKAVAPLTGEVISFTFSATLDDWAATCSGFSGVDQVTPWDTNVALPASAINDAGSSAPSVSGVSTSGQNTMLIAAAGNADSGKFTNPTSAPSGWTGEGTPASTNFGNLSAECYGAFQAETSPQSGLTVTFSTSLTTWIAVVDALRAAVQAVVTKSSAIIVGF